MNMNMKICSSTLLKDKEGNELESIGMNALLLQAKCENVEIQFANSGNKESLSVEGKT